MINSLVDASIVNDELEMLSLRVQVLRNFGISTFRVCESPTTHQGAKKPLHVSENLNQLRSQFPDCDIDVYSVEIPSNLDPREAENFVRERFCELLFREFPNRSIIFCDVDEIPHITQLINYLQTPTSIFSLHMKLSYLFGNLHHKGVPVFTYSKIGPSSKMVATRDVRWKKFPKVAGELGAHLSFCGFSESSYLNKLASYGQPEFNVKLLNSLGYIDLTKELAIDPLARYHLRGKGILQYVPVEPESLLFLVFTIKPHYFTTQTTYSLLSRLLCSADISFNFLKGRFETSGTALICLNLELRTFDKLKKLITLQIRIWVIRIQFQYRSRVKTQLYRFRKLLK